MSQAGFFGVSTPGSGVSSVEGNNGVTASPTTGDVIVSGVLATTSSVGVASFNPLQFTVDGSGEVSALNLSVLVRTFESSTTYVPTAGMAFCIVEIQGSGGGGAGCAATLATQVSAGAGGGGGGYTKQGYSALDIGASQAIVIGAPGAGGIGLDDGEDGEDCTFGALLLAQGGAGGNPAAAAVTTTSFGGNGGNAGGGSITMEGGGGSAAFGVVVGAAGAVYGGNGGDTFYAGSREAPAASTPGSQSNGNDGNGYGGGGTGALSLMGGTAANGGSGFAGVVVVTEFILS